MANIKLKKIFKSSKSVLVSHIMNPVPKFFYTNIYSCILILVDNVGPTMSLATYIRDVALLTGTKV